MNSWGSDVVIRRNDEIFISYVYYEEGQPSFGNAEWEGESITSLEDITAIETEIAQQFGEKKVFVKLLFWRLFGKD